MGYISVKEASAKWGLSERRTRELCGVGRVFGAVRSGRDWLIPNDAQKPAKGKARKGDLAVERLELYLNPTYCDNRPPSAVAEEERLLCQAEDLFLKGCFDEATQVLGQLTGPKTSDPYLMVALMTLYLIRSCSEPSAEAADLAMAEVKKTLERNPGFKYTRDLVGCVLDEKIEPANLSEVPSRFMPIFAESACYIGVMDDLAGRQQASSACLELLARTVDEEEQPALALYCNVALTLYHHLRHEPDLYNRHVHKALEIALPRKWYAPLANTAYVLPWHEVKDADLEAYREIQRLSGTILDSYIRSGHFGGALPGIDVMGTDEFRVAYMSAQGMSVKDISATLGLTAYKVRKTLKSAYNHTGTTSRKGLQELLTRQFKAL